MDLLAGWIGQIIVFILMAVVIDLIVPNLTFRKYINLVVGLILILILLTPLFKLFQLDMENDLAGWYNELFEEDEQILENSIDTQKDEIEQTQDAYILEEMAVQLKVLVEEELLKNHKAEIISIDFEFQDSSEKSYESLEEVIVYVQEITSNRGLVEQVDEITIPIEKEEEVKQDEAIAELLQDLWELDDKEITVYWEGGTS